MKAILLANAAVLCLPACALAQTSNMIDSVILTASPDPQDPPAVADARSRLSKTPGAASAISAESYANRFAQTTASAASAAYWPGDGRSVFGGVTVSF